MPPAATYFFRLTFLALGAAVFPDAELKFYITASSRIRAERRAIDMELAGQPCDVDQIQKDIEARDYRDMHRASSPLVKVPDAIEIDTTDASLEESVAEVMGHINSFWKTDALCGGFID